jgi:hypothetical protein
MSSKFTWDGDQDKRSVSGSGGGGGGGDGGDSDLTTRQSRNSCPSKMETEGDLQWFTNELLGEGSNGTKVYRSLLFSR